MDYRKRKINPIIILSILFLFQKSFGSNYLKDISFYGKENGLIVEFVFEKEVSPDSVKQASQRYSQDQDWLKEFDFGGKTSRYGGK